MVTTVNTAVWHIYESSGVNPKSLHYKETAVFLIALYFIFVR